MIDKLTKIIPIGSLLLIVVGFLKLKLFYLLFEVNISSFINISDVINSFIDDSIYIVYAMIFSFYSLIENIKTSDGIKEDEIRRDERIKFFNKVTEDLKGIMEKPKNEETKYFADGIEAIKSKKRSTKDIFRIILLIVFSFLFIYYFFTPQTKKATDIYILIAGIFPLLLVRTFETSVYLFDKYYYETIVFLSIITISGAITNKEYYCVKYDNKYSNYIIQMGNKTIKCDKNNYYIGKTESYLFVYNCKLKESTAYRTDNIDYIILKK